MLLENATPFAAIGFGDLHRDGMRMAVIAVRGSYVLSADGALVPANAQKVLLNDVYEGDPHRTPLLQVGDLVAYRPAADVTVLGSAYAPGGRPARSWTVGVRVGEHAARLRVHGPRRWEPTLSFLTPTWKLGEAAPAASIALDYRLAAGGYHLGDAQGQYDRHNPIGPGVLRRDTSRVGHPLRAPQIEGLKEGLSDPFAEPEPRGFGPVPPFWAWRTRHLGTRDEAWQRERCPQMPEDFDYRFFQCAHPSLVMPRLRGDETVQLDRLMPGGGSVKFTLPKVALISHHVWRDGRRVMARMTLDGVHVDLRAPEGPWSVALTWRGWIRRCPAYEGARLAVATLDEVEGLPGSAELDLEDGV